MMKTETLNRYRNVIGKMDHSLGINEQRQLIQSHIEANKRIEELEAELKTLRPVRRHLMREGCSGWIGRKQYGIHPKSSDLCVTCNFPYILHSLMEVPGEQD